MRDKHQVIEEPCEVKVSCTVLKTSGAGDSLAEFNRSCHDAIEAIYASIHCKSKFVLDADIAKCFDRIDHEALLNKLNTFPTIRRQIRAWLKAGVMDNMQYFDTSEGTPQGGVISPLLANIALHGMEERVKEFADTLPTRSGFGKRDNRKALNFIRYADDFVILHEDITVVQRCKEIISEWLKGMGLELKPSKTKIAHTLNQCKQEQPGFNFLGFNIRQFSVGKYQSGKSSRGSRLLGFKTIITPSKEKLKVHYDKIAEVIEAHKTAPQVALISRMNPIIRGWANYYSTVISKEAFSGLDRLIFLKLFAWAKRRHPNKSKEWVVKKYWQTLEGDNWEFATRSEGKNPMRLQKHSATEIKRHVKVKSESSPYDGNLVYWSTRMGNNPEMPKRVSTLLKKQKGKCTHCGLIFRENDVMEVDHRIPKSQGGKDSYNNWQLLHRHCHDTKTTTDLAKAKAEEMEIIERFERVKAIAQAYASNANPTLRQSVDVPGNKSGCNSAEPKPTKRLEKVEDKWVMRYA
ncbi:MAG: reverse transcriptase domain-containing protein [Coleofasciculaceae cyanobacterium]